MSQRTQSFIPVKSHNLYREIRSSEDQRGSNDIRRERKFVHLYFWGFMVTECRSDVFVCIKIFMDLCSSQCKFVSLLYQISVQ